MKSSMACMVIDRLFLVVLGAAAPREEEWQAYLRRVERHGIHHTQQLIVTAGGRPSRDQRRRLAERLAGRGVPVAVVADSAMFRGLVTAMSGWNRSVRAFPPSGLRDVIAYLEIPTSRLTLIEREIERLTGEIDHPASTAVP